MAQMDEARTMTLWLMDAVRGNPVRFASAGRNTHAPVWTPDGASLVYTSDHDGPSNLYIQAVDGAEPSRRLTISEQHQDAGSFSPDGKLLTYVELHPDTNWDVWVLDMESGEVRPFLMSAAEEMQPIVAPSGNLYAYTSNETGRREIYLERFPDGGRKQRVSTDGGEDPAWSRDGGTLYYRWRSVIYAVPVTDTDGQIETGVPTRRFEGAFEGRAGYGKANWDVAAGAGSEPLDLVVRVLGAGLTMPLASTYRK
jgi:Tol biopolymer transport system component